MSMEKMLYEEIESELKALKNIKPGEDGHEKAVNSVTKLMDRAIELKKIESDANSQVETRNIETDLKMKQMADEKKDRLIKNIMTGTKDAVVFIGTIWAIVASFNFEREGTLTSSAGRKNLSKALSWFK